jgi:tetratricopeptide (TPR) repeat protein/ADP-heptose:LPS heptosyltransferase
MSIFQLQTLIQSKSLTELYDIALKHQQEGELSLAEFIYDGILNQQIKHAEQLHNLGMNFFREKQYARAIECIQKAVAFYSKNYHFYANLGVIHSTIKQYQQAIIYYRKSLEIKSDNADVLHNLGMTYQNLQQSAEAIEAYNQALKIDPDHKFANRNLAQLLESRKKIESVITNYQADLQSQPLDIPITIPDQLQQALAAYQQLDFVTAEQHCQLIVQQQPDCADAWYIRSATAREVGNMNLAIDAIQRAIQFSPNSAHYHLSYGLTLAAQKKFIEAVNAYQQALILQANYLEAHYNLGNALIELKRYSEAVATYQQVLRLNPNHVSTHNNLAEAYRRQDQLSLAIQHCRAALAINPKSIEAHNNLGGLLQEYGQFNEACDIYRQALMIQPNYINAKYNLGLALLALGNYAEGWDCYEARYHPSRRDPNSALPPLNYSQWSGQSLIGKSILIWSEQGMGDIMQMCRYAQFLKQQGAIQVSWFCKPVLKTLLQRVAGIDQVWTFTEQAQIPPHDYWSLALSLPLHCQTLSFKQIPTAMPYLYADPLHIEIVKRSLAVIKGAKIGVCWKGNPKFPGDKHRSPGLAVFQPIFKVLGAQFFTLQPDTREEFLAVAAPVGVDIGHEIGSDSFDEAAAIIMNMDLIISSDTSIAHLAAGLGKPTWLVLPFVADWRWLTEHGDSPWYPTMRLFRQSERGHWSAVIDQVVVALEDWIKQSIIGQDYRGQQLLKQILRYRQQADFQTAEILCRQLLAEQPHHADAWHTLGLLAHESGQSELALSATQRAAELQPNHYIYFANLGMILKVQERFNEAEQAYRRAIELKPDYAEGYGNLAYVLQQQNRFEEAIDSYQQSLALRPEHPQTHFAYALLLLTLGRYAQAWKHNEYRHDAVGKRRSRMPSFTFPQWQGENLQGKSIVVWPEQGFGDEIQFCRYVFILKQLGAKTITLICKRQLTELFNSLTVVNQVFGRENNPEISDHDYWTFVQSIPCYVNTELATIPATIPYLFAPLSIIQSFAEFIKPIREFKIGICWQGSKTHLNDKRRSPRIELFKCLSTIPNIKFFTIQPETRNELLTTFPETAIDIGREINIDQFSDAAGLISQLDLIISCDTSVAHLAAALGKPVWILLAYHADWRWLIDRENSPWYPNVRLFRQIQLDDWDGVFDKVYHQLKNLIQYSDSITI